MIQQFHSWEYIQKTKNTSWKRCKYPNVHSSTIYNCQDLKAACVHQQMNVSIDDEEDMVYIYNGVLLSHKRR